MYIYMPSSTYPPRKACAASARVLSSWMPAWLRNETIVACNCHIHTCDICYHHHTQLHGIFILFPHMMESRVQTQSASIATCEVHTSKFTHPLDVSQIQRHAREAVPPKQIASFFKYVNAISCHPNVNCMTPNPRFARANQNTAGWYHCSSSST